MLSTRLLLENLALGQQLGVLKRKHPQSRLAPSDKFFLGILRRLWPGWKRALILVQPETVIRRHLSGSSCNGRASRGIGSAWAEGA
jgi:hypothetical protein